MRRIFRTLTVFCAIVIASLPVRAGEAPVTVFAAASLRDVLEEAAARYEGADVVVSYGGSGMIARQVAQGAPADLVILANTAWAEWLQQSGVVPLGMHNIASNQMVVVSALGSEPVAPDQIVTRLGAQGRLAVGHTIGVPAGIYARQWLTHVGLWSDLRTRLAETENVRAALALVERGEAPLGVVYRSDAMASDAVHVVYAIPADQHDPIRYPMALLHDRASGFAQFLRSDAGQALFAAHGFAAPEAGS